MKKVFILSIVALLARLFNVYSSLFSLSRTELGVRISDAIGASRYTWYLDDNGITVGTFTTNLSYDSCEIISHEDSLYILEGLISPSDNGEYIVWCH